MIGKIHLGMIAALSLAAAAIAGPPAAADPVADFYKGREVTLLIGHPPGGSYDLYAQLSAAHIGKFMPGHPTVIVQHMPGGGAAKALTHFYYRAPHDGSVIGLFPETIANTQLMDPKRGRWDVSKMQYIGSLTPVNSAFVVKKGGPVKTAQDIFKIKVNAGCTGRNSQSYQYPATLAAFAGAKFNMICGYKGSAGYTLALLRGEVDMVSKAWPSWLAENKDDLDSGKLIPIVQGGLKRTAGLEKVPLMQELTKDPVAKQALIFISGGSNIGRALIAPPGMPADRLAAWRAAFDKMVKDADFLADAKKRNMVIDPSPGTETQKDSLAILNTPREIVDRVAKVFKK
jgi:tripartite-type tricarboxylate transporter receptor subunit TctC